MLQSRRDVLRNAVLVAAATGPLIGQTAPAADVPKEVPKELVVPSTPAGGGKDPWQGLKVGVASYSFRKLPLEQTIAGIKRIDLHYVSIKDAHLPLKSSTEEQGGCSTVSRCGD